MILSIKLKLLVKEIKMEQTFDLKKEVEKLLSNLEDEIEEKIEGFLSEEADSVDDCADIIFQSLKNNNFEIIEELSFNSHAMTEVVSHEYLILVKYKNQEFKIFIYEEYDYENFYLVNFKLHLQE